MGRATNKIESELLRKRDRILELSSLPFSGRGRHKLKKGVELRVGKRLFGLVKVYRKTLIRHVRIVAVAGSMGKTTTTRAVAAVLGRDVEAVEGWNSWKFLPLFLLGLRPSDRIAVTETGIKHKGDMQKISELLLADTVVVTSVSTDHHRFLGSIENIRAEKAKSVQALAPNGVAVLNGDDPNVVWMRDRTRARVITFGFEPTNDIQAIDYSSLGLSGSELAVQIGKKIWNVRTKLIGRHMAYAALAALAVAHSGGIPMERAVKAINDLAPTPHRLQPLALPQNSAIILDDYKMTMATIEPALRTLSDVPATRRTVVLGEIFEPPGDAAPLYRRVGELCAELTDRILFCGSDEAARQLLFGGLSGGMRNDQIIRFRNVREAAELLSDERLPGEVILLKGLGTLRLSRIALILQGLLVSCDKTECRAMTTYSCSECPSL